MSTGAHLERLIGEIAPLLREKDWSEEHPALARGVLGAALFLHAHGTIAGDQSSRDVAFALVEQGASLLCEAGEAYPGLLKGLAGLTFVGRLLGMDVPAADVDERILRHLDGETEVPGLIDGVAGLGAYGLFRLTEGDCLGAEIVSNAVVRLRGQATAWSDPRRGSPSGAAFSRGPAGILAFLVRAGSAGIPVDDLTAMGLERVIENERIGRLQARGFWAQRQAWCGGKLGTSTSLALASAERENEELAAFTAGELASLLARGPWGWGIVDCTLCHGWAGAAHLALRCSEATGDERWANVADECWRGLFATRLRSGPNLGFMAPKFRNDSLSWEPEVGLLQGLVGIGLAALSALDQRARSWAWDFPLLVASRHARLDL